MSGPPVIGTEREREWETWPAEQAGERGEVYWKTLISAGLTDSDALALGIARVPPGGTLQPHRHEQPEVYLVLDGCGDVTVDGATRAVRSGDAVFIPGNAVHTIACTGTGELRFAYVFAADSSGDVVYDFGR
jgi:quercetin dioxygenase-like cupin family protein